MINTALLSPCSCRSTMEHVYGILLDEKFLYRSVHAAFVNTKWYEAWLERTLLLDPIIFDMWSPGVLSWAPGQHCNRHHARHTGQDTLVVPCLRCGSFLYHKSVGGRGCGQLPDAFFPLPDLPRRRGESLGGVRVLQSRHRFVCFPQILVIACVFPQSIVIACVFPQSIVIACVFPQSIVIALVFVFFFFASGAARARSFCTHQRSRITESTVFKHIHHRGSGRPGGPQRASLLHILFRPTHRTRWACSTGSCL